MTDLDSFLSKEYPEAAAEAVPRTSRPAAKVAAFMMTRTRERISTRDAPRPALDLAAQPVMLDLSERDTYSDARVAEVHAFVTTYCPTIAEWASAQVWRESLIAAVTGQRRGGPITSIIAAVVSDAVAVDIVSAESARNTAATGAGAAGAFRGPHDEPRLVVGAIVAHHLPVSNCVSVEALAVHPRFRRRDIADALLRRVARDAAVTAARLRPPPPPLAPPDAPPYERVLAFLRGHARGGAAVDAAFSLEDLALLVPVAEVDEALALETAHGVRVADCLPVVAAVAAVGTMDGVMDPARRHLALSRLGLAHVDMDFVHPPRGDAAACGGMVLSALLGASLLWLPVAAAAERADADDDVVSSIFLRDFRRTSLPPSQSRKGRRAGASGSRPDTGSTPRTGSREPRSGAASYRTSGDSHVRTTHDGTADAPTHGYAIPRVVLRMLLLELAYMYTDSFEFVGKAAVMRQAPPHLARAAEGGAEVPVGPDVPASLDTSDPAHSRRACAPHMLASARVFGRASPTLSGDSEAAAWWTVLDRAITAAPPVLFPAKGTPWVRHGSAVVEAAPPSRAMPNVDEVTEDAIMRVVAETLAVRQTAPVD